MSSHRGAARRIATRCHRLGHHARPFEPPSEGTPFQPIDTDSNGRIGSLFAATQTFSGLAEAPLSQAAQIEIVKSLPLAKK